MKLGPLRDTGWVPDCRVCQSHSLRSALERMKQDNAKSDFRTGDGSNAGRLSPAPILEVKCDSKQKLGGSGGRDQWQRLWAKSNLGHQKWMKSHRQK